MLNIPVGKLASGIEKLHGGGCFFPPFHLFFCAKSCSAPVAFLFCVPGLVFIPPPKKIKTLVEFSCACPVHYGALKEGVYSTWCCLFFSTICSILASSLRIFFIKLVGQRLFWPIFPWKKWVLLSTDLLDIVAGNILALFGFQGSPTMQRLAAVNGLVSVVGSEGAMIQVKWAK